MVLEKQEKGLPSYQDLAVKESQSCPWWRLYIQYEQFEGICLFGTKNFKERNHGICIGVDNPPIYCKIERKEGKVDKFLENVDKSKVLTVVIESSNLNYLEEMKELYTDFKSWNQFAITSPDLQYAQVYTFQAIVQAIENEKGNLAILVSNMNRVMYQQANYFLIDSSPVTEVTCSLRVRFRKATQVPSFLEKEGHRTYFFHSMPFQSTLIYRGEAKEYLKQGKRKGPFVELVFLGNELNLLKDMYNCYMNINFPDKRCISKVFRTDIKQSLIVSDEQNGGNEIVTCIIGHVDCSQGHMMKYHRE